MFKNLLIAIILIFVAVYFIDPSALTPWKDVASEAGEVAVDTVKKTGDAVKDGNVIEKTKESITEAVSGK